MKNFTSLRLFLATVLLAMVAGTAWADETFDFTQMQATGTTTSDQTSRTFTSGDVTLVGSKCTIAAENNTNQLRWYANATVTISVPSGATITSVSITQGASGTSGGRITADYDNGVTFVATNSTKKTTTWSNIDKDKVVFKATKQTRITKIVVAYTSGKTATTTVLNPSTSSYTLELNSEAYNSFVSPVASVVYGESTALEGATVTYSSSDADVASVDETTGAVTLGTKVNTTATIKAIYGGNKTYLGSDASYTITLTRPAGAAVTLPYTESFATSFGDFTSDGGINGTEVWSNTNSAAQANGYVSGSRLTGSSRLTSPLIDLTSVAAAKVSFDHAGRYIDNDNSSYISQNHTLWVKGETDTEWTQLEIPNYYAAGATSFTFVNSGEIDLSAFAGQKIYLSFLYTANGQKTGTGSWQIKNVSVEEGAPTIIKSDVSLSLNKYVLNVTEGDDPYEVTVSTSATYDGTISVESTNEAVAKAVYADGKITVTFVGAGTAAINVTAEETENFNADSKTIEVTVTSAPMTVIDLRGKTESIVLNSFSSFTGTGYTSNNEYIITSEAKKQYVFDVTACMLSKQRLQMQASKGKVVSPTILSDYGYSVEVTFTNSKTMKLTLGNEATVESETTSPFTVSTNATDGQFILQVGSGYNIVSSITVTPLKMPTSGTVTITNAGYSTHFSNAAFEVPTGMTAGIITNSGTADANGMSQLTIDWKYEAGSIVPAKTALIVKGEPNTYTYTCVNSTETAPEGNLLHGSATATTTTGGDKYYMLSYGNVDGESTLGFFYGSGCPNGEAFTSAAGKCWLAISGGAGVKGFYIDFDDVTTSINSVNTAITNGAAIYDLQGRRVNVATRGLYIIGGKKVLVK